jgi:hypothetical protein
MDLINDECIYEVWIHSYEEDDDTKMVYRTPSFNFPLSRRRDTFEITKSGEIISYLIGAYEAYQKKNRPVQNNRWRRVVRLLR